MIPFLRIFSCFDSCIANTNTRYELALDQEQNGDVEKAERNFAHVASTGDMQALFKLGVLLYKKNGWSASSLGTNWKVREEAVDCVSQAARAGIKEANEFLTVMEHDLQYAEKTKALSDKVAKVQKERQAQMAEMRKAEYAPQRNNWASPENRIISTETPFVTPTKVNPQML